jgi:hypothetical protein
VFPVRYELNYYILQEIQSFDGLAGVGDHQKNPADALSIEYY